MNPVFTFFLIGLVFLACSFLGLGFLFMPWQFTMLFGLFFVGIGTLTLLLRKLELELTAMDKNTFRGECQEYLNSGMPPKGQRSIPGPRQSHYK